MLPVTAHVMMTLRRLAMVSSLVGIGCVVLVLPQCEQARVAPAHARVTLVRAAERFELTRYILHVGGVPHGRRGRIGGERAIEAGVARAIIGDTTGSVELDRRERTDERPAQAQPVLDSLVEVLRRHVALADEAQRFGKQRALE